MQNAHRIGPDDYRRSHLEQLRRLLEDLRFKAELLQRQRGGQTANAAADDSDSHQLDYEKSSADYADSDQRILMWHARRAQWFSRARRPCHVTTSHPASGRHLSYRNSE